MLYQYTFNIEDLLLLVPSLEGRGEERRGYDLGEDRIMV